MELNEILTTARNFLKGRTDSLMNDVKRCCLTECKDTKPAPFTVLLYCFSTIDLLGELYGGDAREKRKKGEPGISELSRFYITQVMNYPEEKAVLVQKVFRHKIVHLAQPNPIIEYKGDSYGWYLEPSDRGIHLEINSLNKKKGYYFMLSVQSFAEDISNSVYKPNGYLHRLENEEDLRLRFENAYCYIFE